MRKTLYWMVGLIVATVLLIGCVSNQETENELPRIAIAGIAV